MKTKWKLLCSLLSLGLVVGSASNISTLEKEKDTTKYDDEISIPYELGETVYPKKANSHGIKTIRLHYLNDDGQNADRQFYIWFQGYNGKALEPIITEEGTHMYIDLVIDENASEVEQEGVYYYTRHSDATLVNYIIKYRGTWDGQSVDAKIEFEDYASYVTDEGLLEMWIISGGGGSTLHYPTREETESDKFTSATFTDWNTIKIVADAAPSSFSIYAYDSAFLKMDDAQRASVLSTRLIANYNNLEEWTQNADGKYEYEAKLNYSANINIQYNVSGFFPSRPMSVQTSIVTFENLYESDRFEQYFTYLEGDLGAIYSKEKTTFTVWAPTTALMRLRIYENGTPSAYYDIEGNQGDDTYKTFDMVYRPGGIWTITILGDLNGKYYTYEVNNSNGTNEIVDPYAKGAGVNGLRGYIYNYDDTDPEGWDNIPPVWDQDETFDIDTPTELSVYEVHIRDLTMDDTWTSNNDVQRGTYNAFVEEGTTYTDGISTVTTGFDHLVELGINAVQLLPVFDHDDDESYDVDTHELRYAYNWGYNPLNYNVVEGAYSSDPYDGAVRIQEFKNMILKLALSKNNIRVIMDVVYNHVSSANASNFNILMPRYYFRHAEDGSYMNGSGCNNEIKSEAPMMRRFIVDSVYWWASEYKIKGFRFDLMGLIDVETMKQVKETLYELDPDIVVYGEGWSAGTPGTSEDTATNQNVYSMLYASSDSPGYVGGFSDTGRNALKGENNRGGWEETTNPYPGYGFISQGVNDVGDKPDKVADMLLGFNRGVGANNYQTINYVSCHDNYTLWDQLNYTLGVGVDYDPAPSLEPNPVEVAKASLAAHSVVMYSQGIAFIHGGEELFRTKILNEEDLVNSIPYEPGVHPVWSPDRNVIPCTADVKMYGKVISHNSYASSDECNSFKWDRKISIDYQGQNIDMTSFSEAFSEMINNRDISPRIMWIDYTSEEYSTVANTWKADNGSVVAGYFKDVENDKNYHLIISCRDGGSIGYGGIKEVIFNSYGGNNGYTFNNSTLTLSPYQFLFVEGL